jgi:hypothetical protein
MPKLATHRTGRSGARGDALSPLIVMAVARAGIDACAMMRSEQLSSMEFGGERRPAKGFSEVR